jgi:hypothetical protein
MDMYLNVLCVLAGSVIVAWILWDVFQTVIVPRPTPTRVRLARYLTRSSWRLWRRRAARKQTSAAREKLLGSFAPALVVTLIGSWLAFLIVGYGLILFGLRAEISPRPDLATAIYQSGITVLTIGYGDVVAQGTLSRITELVAAGTGLGIVAMGITYLFSLYGSFQRREELVTTLDARAGAPPSGVKMLETYAELGIWDDLRRSLAEWEVWCAQVLDSHVAYPILCFFRSSHDNESWVSAIGAVLDAGVLLATTIENGPDGQPVARGQAILTVKGGTHLVDDIGRFLSFKGGDGVMVERAEFTAARQRLANAGITLLPDEDAAWRSFSELRSSYASAINQMAAYLLTPPTQWIGDRSMTSHAGRIGAAMDKAMPMNVEAPGAVASPAAEAPPPATMSPAADQARDA